MSVGGCFISGTYFEEEDINVRMFKFHFIPDNIKKTVNRGDIKINIKQDYEVQYWSRKWGISSLQLESAVKASGSKVARNVEQYLRQIGKIY